VTVILYRVASAKPKLKVHNLNFGVNHTLVMAVHSHETCRLELPVCPQSLVLNSRMQDIVILVSSLEK